MRIHLLVVGLAVAASGSRPSAAQPAADPAASPATPSQDAAAAPPRSPAGPAGEPEPEPVGRAKPVEPDEPITVDQIVIASTARIDLNFFGDVSLLQISHEEAGFSIGPLGFQVAAHLAEGLVGRTEFAMEFEDGDTVVDVERAYLEYRTDHWMFAAGRTHAELGYWNNAFHHGRWLQLTINRPRVLRFEDEGGMLPIHQVGATVVYGPRRGDAGLELGLGIGNGHGRVLEAIQTGGDNNRAKSLLLRVGAVGIGHPALRFGINLGLDSIAPEPATVRPLAPDTSILELITGVYLALRGEHAIVFSETYNVMHRAMGTSWQVTDGFVLAGYRLGRFIPFGQIEARRGDGASDPFYNPAAAINSETIPPVDYIEGIAGLHFDLNTWSAFKLELTARRQGGLDDYRAELNWSFGR